MKGKTLNIVSLIVIAAPWLFLLEIIPIPYNRISTAAEVIAEAVMFAALLTVAIFLKKEHKRVLFVLACISLVVVGLILVLIAVSFML